MQTGTPSRMLSVGEAAKFLRISKSWLNKRRCLGGPDAIPFIKIGRRVAYSIDDLAAFVARRRRRTTSEST
jgi:helix-turn-helix protein